MMKIGIWNNYTWYAENKLFAAENYLIGDDLGYPFILLKEKLLSLGYELDTLDMHPIESFDKYIFLDYPSNVFFEVQKIPKEKKYLILLECEMINTTNAQVEYYSEFQKVFTSNDTNVIEQNCEKFFSPVKIRNPIEAPWMDRKFSVLIAGNKHTDDPRELYSERVNTIHFFENNYPQEFDLYGMGWELGLFKGSQIKEFFNRSKIIRKLFADKFPSYKGKVDHKIETLSQYRFCICYENAQEIPGYITEKIFDCFFAGCIPIYWGAPNVCEFIPSECFIDRRKFTSNQELYDFLHSLDESDYTQYMRNINKFLKSDAGYKFSAESFVQLVIDKIIND